MEAAQADKQQLASYEIPLSEAKAKKWVESLSTTDFGETTRRIFYGLVDFNRRMVPPLVRVRIAEYLRPKVDLLVGNLQRHLSYQAFPLPARGQKISDLNQSLLLEFAGTYQLAALDMLNKDSGRKRALQIAIYRVIDYLGQYLLSTYSVYIQTRDTVWHDIHHMYLLASERGMDVLEFNDGKNKPCSIESRYIQVNVLALFKPYSVRQEEALRIARYVQENSHLISISRELADEERLGDFVHAAVLNNDEPAVTMPYGDLPHSPTVRVFNLRQLIMKIDSFIDEIAYENSSALILTNGLSRNLAKRMVYHLTTIRNRQHNRFESNSTISAAMGMGNVLQVLNNANQKKPAAEMQEEDLLFNNAFSGDTYSVDVAAEDHEVPSDDDSIDEGGVSIWMTRNNSVGGYGLYWNERETSDVRVGELAGLRDMKQADNSWMVGVVKWMEYVPKAGLACGVELLSVQVKLLKVLAIRNRDPGCVLTQDGLMLPRIEGIREESSLILPAYVFRPGDELNVNFDEREAYIVLGALDECLGAFAYFSFKVLDSTQIEESANGDDEFENLWDVL